MLVAIKNQPACIVYPPNGLPTPGDGARLPEDVQTFYTLCGGVHLFGKSNYAITIVPFQDVQQANPIILGDFYSEDISYTWYIIARDDNNDFLSIDLSESRSGRCYDSFTEVHAVAGSCPIIARSFTELLSRLFDNAGQYWYWLRSDFAAIGDAYDGR